MCPLSVLCEIRRKLEWPRNAVRLLFQQGKYQWANMTILNISRKPSVRCRRQVPDDGLMELTRRSSDSVVPRPSKRGGRSGTN